MIDRGIEIGRLCGMKMNVEKPKIMNISRQSSPAQTAGNKKNWRILNIPTIWVA